MEYDKIILDLMNRVVILEEKVRQLEKGNVQPKEPEVSVVSKKYRFLSDYLFASGENRVILTFREIEDILKFKLPESATVHRAFWANTTSHSIALSWLSVDFLVVEANLEKEYIIFEKKREFEKMTLDEQMRIIVREIISEYGIHYQISLKELYELLGARFQTKNGSIIPSDYCYNRVNKGIDFEKKPRLFKLLGDGEYECLGENYPFTGDVSNANGKTVVGTWKDGDFQKNKNWTLLGLK